MVHDVLAAAGQVAETLGQVGGDEAGEQVLRVRVDVGRVFDAAFEDVFVDFHGRAAVPEGGEAAQHFEDEDAERPPVRICVSFVVVLAATVCDMEVVVKHDLTSPRICCNPLMTRLRGRDSRVFRKVSR